MSGLQTVVITYNCGREPVKPAVFSSHLAGALQDASPSPELIVFALQEIAPVAYSFLGGSFLKSYLEPIHATVDLTAQKWDDGRRPYKALLSRHVSMTAIVVFARDDVKERVVRLDAGGVGVGWYEMGNKGAVAVNVKLRGRGADQPGSLETTFVAAHLAPMEWQLERRNEDWKNIVRGLVLTPVSDQRAAATRSGTDAAGSLEEEPLLSGSGDGASTDVDGEGDEQSARVKGLYCPDRHLVVAGDLNYRTSSTAPRPQSKAMFPRLSDAEDSPQHHRHLLANDQLKQEINASRSLHGFVEAPITFAPTYKYSNSARKAMGDLEENELKRGARRDETLDTPENTVKPPSSPLDWPWSSHRWPSWCDRVLYLSGKAEGFKPKKYTSLPLMSTSDHQPVILQFEIPWSSPRDEIRDNPPFQIDSDWQSRRAAARRLEVMTGLAAYLSTTWEGSAVLTALVVGSLGGWYAVQSFM